MVSKISGIYAYYDNLRCEIVYVGRDSNIKKHLRYKDHYKPSRKDEQVINKVLQNDNNSGRYIYVILEQGDFTNDMLNEKEISWISFFKPKFNFTEGGDGVCGYRHTKQAREKISETTKGENHPFYGKKHSEESRKKISEAQKGENNSQFNSFIKIRKRKDNTCKQGFRWRARPSTPEKQIDISSVYLQKCIEKVEDFIQSNENVYGYESYEVVE